MNKFLSTLVNQVKNKSCDKHTKIGALIVNTNGQVLIESCNIIPYEIKITNDRLERPIKYNYIEHAERNACFYAAKNGIKLDGTIMYMSCNPVPCVECSRAIISSGIKMIVGKDIKHIASDKWTRDCDFSLEMLIEAGIIVVYIDYKGKVRIIGSPDNKYKQFLKDL